MVDKLQPSHLPPAQNQEVSVHELDVLGKVEVLGELEVGPALGGGLVVVPEAEEAAVAGA